MFIGRKKELAELERAYQMKGFHIFVVGGPEGSGKTTLVEEFCKDKESIFFTASHDNGRANLMRFSSEVLAHYKDFEHEPFNFWDTAFKYIRDMQDSISEWNSYPEKLSTEKNDNKVIVVLDELAELAQRDSVFIDMFRKCIDFTLMESKIFMIITSCDAKFLQRTILDEGSILHYRLAGSIMLDKFVLNDDTVAQLKEQAAKNDKHIDTRKIIKYSADDIIIREGEINPEMYKIISGKAVCYVKYGTENEYVIGTLKEGRTFGEYSLLTGRPGIYTVAAFTDILVLRIGSDEFSKFIEMNASNAVEIMKNLAEMINIFRVNVDMLHSEVMQSLQ